MADKLQIGVVPILVDRKGCLVVLVTARGKDRWLPPKGNVHRRHSNRTMALTEAYEEAGIVGTIRHKHYVDVPFCKAGERITLRLYPMQVQRVLKTWPEKTSRQRTIVRPRKAYKLIDCKKLRAGMTRLVTRSA